LNATQSFGVKIAGSGDVFIAGRPKITKFDRGSGKRLEE